MRLSGSRAALLVAVVLLAAAVFWVGGGRAFGWASSQPTVAAPAASASPSAKPAAAAKPSPAPKVAAASDGTTAQAKPGAAAQAKPGRDPAQAKPTATPRPAPVDQTDPSDPIGVNRAQIAKESTWASGNLREHFQKHGREGPWGTQADYDASARETITTGKLFTYVDLTTHAERLGFYDAVGNRFTSVTLDGERINTHFRPDRGEAYVRALPRSNYR
jgi:hypothetical protein